MGRFGPVQIDTGTTNQVSQPSSSSRFSIPVQKEEEKTTSDFTRGATNVIKQPFEIVGGLVGMAGRGLKRVTRGVFNPIDEGIPDVKENLIPNIAETGKVVGRGFQEFGKFVQDIPGARTKAKEGLKQLKELPQEERFKAIRNVETAVFQGGEDSTLAKFVGATALSPALSILKLKTAPKETLIEEPVYTFLDVAALGKVTGLNKIVKAGTKELGAAGLEQLSKGRLGPSIDLYKQKLKVHADKKEYTKLDVERMDEWFDHHNQILDDYHTWFNDNLTLQEKKLYPAYAKGLLETPSKADEFKDSMFAKILAEARKYKSADEFVNAQGKPLYRGGEKIDIKKVTSQGISTSKSKDVADYWKNRRVGGVMEELYIDKNAKIYKPKLKDEAMNFAEKQSLVYEARNKGFDALDLAPHEAEVVILNPKVIKTKSQLTDIWNKANKI